MKIQKQKLNKENPFNFIGYEGESIERFCERATASGEPIESSSPIIYTKRSDGVQPQYNIRTDRFEIAAEAMNTATTDHRTKRAEKIAAEATKTTEAAPQAKTPTEGVQ